MTRPPVFLSEEQIQGRVAELAQTIQADLKKDAKGKEVVFIGVLKGSFLFFSDLVRRIDHPMAIDFLGASSYGKGTKTTGVVKLTLDLSIEITGKHVVLVEDIVDTGLTLEYLLEALRIRNPASLRLCALLLKPSNLKKPVPIDYLGFTVDKRFVVGYGLDAGEYYRNLPYLAILPDEQTQE